MTQHNEQNSAHILEKFVANKVYIDGADSISQFFGAGFAFLSPNVVLKFKS